MFSSQDQALGARMNKTLKGEINAGIKMPKRAILYGTKPVFVCGGQIDIVWRSCSFHI